MKFEHVIMNPPYDGNLHLKIIESSLNHIGGESALCVNLSPIRWLQDPLAKYKNGRTDYNYFENSIIRHIRNLEKITALDAQITFNIICNMDLGIYSLDASDSHNPIFVDEIIEKVVAYNQEHKPILDELKKDGWRVRIPKITAGRSGGKGIYTKKLMDFGKLYVFHDGELDGKKWYEFYQRNQFTKTTDEITWSIWFESFEKANNFINSLQTDFGKYYMDSVLVDVHVVPEQILWVGDIPNPRTGKLGYESDWTDEDFCRLFGIESFSLIKNYGDM